MSFSLKEFQNVMYKFTAADAKLWLADMDLSQSTRGMCAA